MYCNQCEQTAKGIACTTIGVCGKNEEVADLEDLLIYALCGMSLFADEARKQGIVDEAMDRFTMEAVFSTLTNVDFDPERFGPMINKVVELREGLKEKIAAAGGKTDFDHPAASFTPADTIEDMAKQGADLNFIPSLDSDENVPSSRPCSTALRALPPMAIMPPSWVRPIRLWLDLFTRPWPRCLPKA